LLTQVELYFLPASEWGFLCRGLNTLLVAAVPIPSRHLRKEVPEPVVLSH
jgi:hypothetical protein